MNSHYGQAAAKSLGIAVATAAVSLGFFGAAQATHHAWTHVNGGGSCVKAGVGGHRSSSVQINEALWNRNTAENKRILCPVNLGGSFDDSTGQFRRHTKVPAKRAEVHYYDPSPTEDISCVLVGLTEGGVVRGSEILYSCGTEGGCRDSGDPPRDPAYVGIGVLKFANPNDQEQRGIRDATTLSNVRSLSYQCRLTKAHPENGWSGITGVLASICKKDPATSGYGGNGACFDFGENTEPPRDRTDVQDNGITCRPQDGLEFGRFSRSERGIKNISTQTTRKVYCPITPPTYDSHMQNHLIWRVEIYVNSFGRIPTCRIYTMARDGTYHGSDTIGVTGTDRFNPRSILFNFSGLKNPEGAISVGYSCDMPPGSEIHGAISHMSIPRIQGGI